MKLVTRIKLNTTEEQHRALCATMRAFNRACNFAGGFAFEKRIFSKLSLHHEIYRLIRADFGLSAQLTARVIGKVCDAYTTECVKARNEQRELVECRFRDDSAVVYDSRILTYGKDSLSIRTLKKRITVRAIYKPGEEIPRFQGEADLVLQKNVFYLLQTVDVKEPETVETAKYLGVDLGIVNLAYDSDANAYTNPGIEARRRKFEKQRGALKKKKTKNARRRLKRIGKRESRYRKDVNHQISKRIVSLCSRTSRGIALEDLSDFFDRTRVRKEQRQERRTWAFAQLRFFIGYKARRAGLPVAIVDPAYTSQDCSVCGHREKANRKSQSEFCCKACGHTAHADHNAASNIRSRAELNQPIAANS